jgi:nitroimidazol reductase NimA-like FMN-containing flavoprotein (pyridoxamine 5'-phosphate oxidase superfamily)
MSPGACERLHSMLDDLARTIIDANRYVTLATAGADGRPWATPVWYAAASPRELLWVSRPAARHSRNVAARPEVAAAIFDSHVAIGEGQAVYVAGVAEQLAGDAAAAAVEAFSRVSQAQGAGAWSASDVAEPAELRLYRLRVDDAWVLEPGGRDNRVPVTL